MQECQPNVSAVSRTRVLGTLSARDKHEYSFDINHKDLCVFSILRPLFVTLRLKTLNIFKELALKPILSSSALRPILSSSCDVCPFVSCWLTD